MKNKLIFILIILFTLITINSYATPTPVQGNVMLYNGHDSFSNNTPILGTCGTAPIITGNDNSFTVIVGSGTVISCTINFNIPFITNPVCTVADNSTTITPDISAISTTSITISTSASIGGGVLYVHCF